MGSVILCHKIKANHPYEITRVHKKLYTIEELCYYLTHNIYLIDNTIMNEQFCVWIEVELQLKTLALQLKDALLEHCSKEQFVSIILQESHIYSLNEMNYIHDYLDKIKEQKEIEHRKHKADNLLKNGEVEEAILVYQAIIREEWEPHVKESFYGKVYACLGAAYGQSFLYHEAMEMYDYAFQICNDPMMVKSYLFAAKQVLEKQEYQLLLAKSQVYEELDEIINSEIEEVEASLQFTPSQEILENWKNHYRGCLL